MSHPRQEDPLTTAFTDLPRQQPSAGFTDEVLAELDRRDRTPVGSKGRWIWATVMSLIAVSALALSYGYHRQQAADRAYRAQVEELRSRYLDLLGEVATVREEVVTPETRLYLGGNERVDLVLDLSPVPAYSDGRQDRQDVRPAAYEQ